jgi:hypothetical protein
MEQYLNDPDLVMGYGKLAPLVFVSKSTIGNYVRQGIIHGEAIVSTYPDGRKLFRLSKVREQLNRANNPTY